MHNKETWVAWSTKFDLPLRCQLSFIIHIHHSPESLNGNLTPPLKLILHSIHSGLLSMIFALLLKNGLILAGLILIVKLLPCRWIHTQLLNRFRRTIQFFSRPRVSIITVFILSFTLAATLSTYKKPVPRIHDEFSYLLAADTFAQGRLTNPTHPFWKHFQSFHIIQKPTYASKYPPGQGLFLAVGQVMTGNPLVGVWLSVSLANAATCWMLQAWVPPKWALAGGLMSTFHPLLILWGQNYFGGGVAILGAALLFGALRRLMISPEIHTTFILGAGLFILAISRPFEGFITAVFSMMIFIVWLATQRKYAIRTIFQVVILPLSVISTFIVGSLAYYNWSVTENFFRFPYQVHEETYSQTPLFIWGTPREVKNDLPHFERFHSGWSFDEYQKHQDSGGYLLSVSGKSQKFIVQMLFFPLSALLLTLPWVLKNPWIQIALSILLVVLLIHLLCMTFFQVYYLAPVIPLVFYVLIQGARHWNAANWNNHNQGRVFLFVLGIFYFALLKTQIFHYLSDPNLPSRYKLGSSRIKLIQQLEQNPQKDLIFVNYSSDHDLYFDWVYNRADIDNAEVVWALPLSDAENQKLIDYFPERRVWQLSVTPKDLKLTPLPNLDSANAIH
ncbi:hypothetical protein [Gimesia sp.]|uniref:hypothetical protein n=1 Tax=Gimesia sp. TaxID=2024833 RepID=UPI000C3D980C|nr:hypothetical protein [Gimesia sp.]MAX35612.1 hypothetical protein [Gimesia sp.]HAH43848.1 hypothetical protein [Planctomycetaceae bacterium]HBL44182.1 hypothetical protein [Planctomycetaceae bacterium]|tara:strand:- start:6339 stop:8189 length:1851 start_codon:yes stop_codon:yes gene_type:complete